MKSIFFPDPTLTSAVFIFSIYLDLRTGFEVITRAQIEKLLVIAIIFGVTELLP